MAKYKIKVIQHLLKNNQIAKSGEIVDASQLINPYESEQNGFVELVAEEKDEKAAKKEAEKAEKAAKKEAEKAAKEEK